MNRKASGGKRRERARGGGVVEGVGAPEAEALAREVYPTLRQEDLVSLPNHQMYVKLLVDGAPTEPFSAETLPPQS
jgi:hypothetical protein